MPAQQKKKTGTQKFQHRPAHPRLKRFYTPAARAWIIMDPARLALLGATVISWLALVIFFLVKGDALRPLALLVRVGATFVVSYAGIGLFVCFIIWVAERELWAKKPAEAVAAETASEEPDAAENESAETEDSAPAPAEEAGEME
jgi:hypothetical protein